jgi:hypothetical protein
MILDGYDFEALSRSRLNRAEGKVGLYKTYLPLVVIIIGYYVFGQGSREIGLGLCGAGGLYLWWYVRSLPAKRLVIKNQLIQEYNEDRSKEVTP